MHIYWKFLDIGAWRMQWPWIIIKFCKVFLILLTKLRFWWHLLDTKPSNLTAVTQRRHQQFRWSVTNIQHHFKWFKITYFFTWSFSQSPIISLKPFCITEPTHWIQQQQNSNNNYAYKVTYRSIISNLNISYESPRQLSLHKVWPMIFGENQLVHFKYTFYRCKCNNQVSTNAEGFPRTVSWIALGGL